MVDVVATFYREEKYAPFFFWGMRENRESLHNVIIVNDEPWTPESRKQVLAAAGDIPTFLLEHEHGGPKTHGVSRSMNQGARCATTEYAFFVTFDQILSPGSLASILEFAAPERMVIGRVDSIAAATTLEDFPDPPILREDMYAASIPDYRAYSGKKLILGGWRNGHTLVHVPSHVAMGGFDERFVQWGYGLEDQEYAARWLLAYGPTSLWWGDSSSWHFAGDQPTALNAEKSQYHPDSVDLFNQRLRDLYEKYEVPNPKRNFLIKRPQ